MMSRHRIAAVVAGVVVVFALVLVAGLASSGSAATRGQTVRTGSASFTDPAGDVQGTAPDITSVVVGDNPASGKITVTATVAGYASGSAAFQLVRVYLNTDKNAATGAPDQGGIEYALGAGRDAEGSGWWIDRWDGSKYAEIAQSATVGFTRSGDVMTWTFNKADIGGSSGFAFCAWSSSWDAADNRLGEDSAPDDGMWSYDLSAPFTPPATQTAPAPLLKPVIAAPTATPAKLSAGKRAAVAFRVVRSDSGEALTTGTMICDPSVGGKVLPHSESFKGGTARLSFLVPQSAKGKSLKVKVTIKVGTQAATRIATYLIN